MQFVYVWFQELDGNTDHDTVVYHHLNPPITARFLRIKPTAWQQHISMRIELYTYRGMLAHYICIYLFYVIISF